MPITEFLYPSCGGFEPTPEPIFRLDDAVLVRRTDIDTNTGRERTRRVVGRIVRLSELNSARSIGVKCSDGAYVWVDHDDIEKASAVELLAELNT